jgi:hypothetical protein
LATLRYKPPKINPKFELVVIGYFTGLLAFFQAVPSLLSKVFLNGLESEYFLLDVFGWPLSFLIVNILFLILIKQQILLRGILMILSAISIFAVRFIFFAPGIIDPVYSFIISAACAGVIGIYRGDYLAGKLDLIAERNMDVCTEKMMEYIRDSYKFLMRSTLQAWLALAASLGVSMSILFRQGYEDINLKYLAMKMLAGFMGISFAIGYWVALPLSNGLLDCIGVLDKMKTKPSVAGENLRRCSRRKKMNNPLHRVAK